MQPGESQHCSIDDNTNSSSCLTFQRNNKRARPPSDAFPQLDVDVAEHSTRKARHEVEKQLQHQRLFQLADAWQRPNCALPFSHGLPNPVPDSAGDESLKVQQRDMVWSQQLATNVFFPASPSPNIDDETVFGGTRLRNLQRTLSCLEEDTHSLFNFGASMGQSILFPAQVDDVASAAAYLASTATLKPPTASLACSNIGQQNPAWPSFPEVQPCGVDQFTLLAALGAAAAESVHRNPTVPSTTSSLQNHSTMHKHHQSLSVQPSPQHLQERGLVAAAWVNQAQIAAVERFAQEKLMLEGSVMRYNDSSVSSPHPCSLGLVHNRTQLQNSTLSEQAKDADGLPNVTVMLLACPWDRGVLTDQLICLRKQLEFFQATMDDTKSHIRGRKKAIALLQVGIRCRHCSHIHASQRQKGSTYFPSKLMGIYQAAQNIGAEHMQSGECLHIPAEEKQILLKRKAPTNTATSGAGKAYWAESAKFMGLLDTDDGIRFDADVANSSLLAAPSTSANFFS